MAEENPKGRLERIFHRIGLVTVSLLLVGVLVGAWLLGRFGADMAVTYKDDRDHFKYGSLGSEHEFGIPYWIWRALPELFQDRLPDGGIGWKSVGFVFEKGKELPVGMSQRRYLGFDLVWLNCAFCHAGTVRETPQSEPQVYAAMPANTFDFRAFMRFLFAAGEDRRFTPRDILRQIKIIRQREGLDDLPLIDRLVLRFYGIYYMRERILTLRDRLNFIAQQPEWGPGRVDTFNPLKAYFNFPVDRLAPEERVGTTDFPSIWNQGQREDLKMNLHWDGNNVSLEERNRSAAMGTGITPPTGDRRSLKRVADWLRSLAAPPYPFAIDKELAAQGAPLYKKYCAECHGADDDATLVGNERLLRGSRHAGDLRRQSFSRQPVSNRPMWWHVHSRNRQQRRSPIIAVPAIRVCRVRLGRRQPNRRRFIQATYRPPRHHGAANVRRRCAVIADDRHPEP